MLNSGLHSSLAFRGFVLRGFENSRGRPKYKSASPIHIFIVIDLEQWDSNLVQRDPEVPLAHLLCKATGKQNFDILNCISVVFSSFEHDGLWVYVQRESQIIKLYFNKFAQNILFFNKSFCFRKFYIVFAPKVIHLLYDLFSKNRM
jgi:hypothetical protein